MGPYWAAHADGSHAQDVARLGKRGAVVDANPGWVRHKLFPSGMVVYATPENLQRFTMVSHEEPLRSHAPCRVAMSAWSRCTRVA